MNLKFLIPKELQVNYLQEKLKPKLTNKFNRKKPKLRKKEKKGKYKEKRERKK